jgi:arylsulfatase A-like enzyme
MWHYEGGSLATYARMVVAMDEAIGRVLAAIEEAGSAGETLVVFTSDNGGERYSYHWPLTGAKGALWEGGIRVPTLVAGASIAPSECDAPCATIDWMPTILALAGIESRGLALDGADLSPVLRGGALAPRTLFWRTQDMGAARCGPWKYLQAGGASFLANLDADITENANFVHRHPEVLERLRGAYREWDAAMLPIPPQARRERWDDLVLRRRSLAALAAAPVPLPAVPSPGAGNK